MHNSGGIVWNVGVGEGGLRWAGVPIGQPRAADVHISDAFDNIVVFPEVQWIGTRESNPDETPLPWPADMLQVSPATLRSPCRGGGGCT
jgi:hypothetical protein